MKTNPSPKHISLTGEKSENDLQVHFFEELNKVYLSKKRLLSFLTELSISRHFKSIKKQLFSLQDEIVSQLKNLDNMYAMANAAVTVDKLEDRVRNGIEGFIMNEHKDFNCKSSLSLFVYLKMIETNEVISVKKLKSLAMILNLHTCLFLLNQSEALIIDSEQFLNKIAFVFTPKIAV